MQQSNTNGGATILVSVNQRLILHHFHILRLKVQRAVFCQSVVVLFVFVSAEELAVFICGVWGGLGFYMF